MEQAITEQYFDPFADPEEQVFDARQSFDALFRRYQEDKIEHDNSADLFVRNTEALMLDAQFAGQFEAFQDIAMQMHALCQDDHMLQASMEGSDLFGKPNSHSEHDGHTHGHADNHADAKESKKSKSEKKEKAKRAMPRGWLQLIFDQMRKRASKAKQ